MTTCIPFIVSCSMQGHARSQIQYVQMLCEKYDF